MTEKFVSAAELMSRILGLPDYGFARIEHPVSSASDAGLEARARATIEFINTLIREPGSTA